VHVLEQLRKGAVYQVGIVVPDLDDALPRYSGLLGIDEWVRYHYGPATVDDFTYREGPAAYSVEVALGGQAPQVELLTVAGSPNLYEEWTAEHGFGLHHVALQVDSVHEATDAMRAAGYDVLQFGSGYGLDGDGGFAYFDTRAELGILVEAIEVPKRRRPPDGVWRRADVERRADS
jgi:catechol 2,3-dioxygenase-like lactoylglutathione lyase family enzyme